MKKYLPIASNIITLVAFAIAYAINQHMERIVQSTYEGEKDLISKAILLLVVGVFVGWNIWVLCNSEKQKIALTLITSIVIDIIVVLIYFFALDKGFFYPIALVGMYLFLIIDALCNKVNE